MEEFEKEMNTIVSDDMTMYGVASWLRFLPSNIDGLKPVQRKILYTAYMNNTGSFIKNVSLVGKAAEFIDTGDSGTYGALVYMGQADRHINPLLVSQGNFGYITGRLSDFAASRYTEAKISDYALDWYMTEDLQFTKWKPNYNNTIMEPVVLPTLMPMGLVQGSEGIAYTHANSALPLKLKSVAKSYVEFLKLMENNKPVTSKEEKRITSYLEFGFVNDCRVESFTDNLFTAGKGSVKMVGDYEIITGDYGRQMVVITKLPYLTEVEPFIEKIQSWPETIKQVISDVKDDSDKEVRISIVLKKNMDPKVVTDFLNMNIGFGSKGSGFKNTKGITYKYFSFKENTVETYSIIKMYKEHYAFKIGVLDEYFTSLINEYEKKLVYLEALLWILSDKNRVDQFINTLKKSDRATLGPNLHKTFKNISEEVLLYIADKKFTVMLKNAADIKDQILDLQNKLKTAKYNKEHKTLYLINQIETKVKKY